MARARPACPQIVREYHARLALALEAPRRLPPGGLYEVANHFYAAGARHAAKGVEYCLRAADASAAGYDFQRARNYLDMAARVRRFFRRPALGGNGATDRRLPRGPGGAAGRQRAEVAAAGIGIPEESSRPLRRGWSWRLPRCVTTWGTAATSRNGMTTRRAFASRSSPHPASPQEEAQARHIMAVSQPPERRAERIADLRKAYALLEHAAAEDREASRWFAQIVNSLAKELSKGTAAERDEARAAVRIPSAIGQGAAVGRPPRDGHGHRRIGPAAWYHEPKNTAEAGTHFRQNLEISEAIGDITAQVKMHSLLGACALEKCAAEQALAHYQRSLELAGDLIDRCFAAAGLLRCHQQLKRREQFEDTAQRLLDWVGPERNPGGLQKSIARGACSLLGGGSQRDGRRSYWTSCER